MTVNGVIFQRRADGLWAWREGREYRGVDGDDWYLEDELWDVREQPWRALRDRVVGYLDALEERSHFDPGLLVAIDDPSWIRLYAEVSEALGVGYRMLLCETDLARPAMGDLGLECDFLGYDCAWPGGDYCSAVLCDLVGGRVFELSDVPLNANGLIPTREAAEAFLWRRERLKARCPESLFEGGDFVVYRGSVRWRRFLPSCGSPRSPRTRVRARHGTFAGPAGRPRPPSRKAAPAVPVASPAGRATAGSGRTSAPASCASRGRARPRGGATGGLALRARGRPPSGRARIWGRGEACLRCGRSCASCGSRAWSSGAGWARASSPWQRRPAT